MKHRNIVPLLGLWENFDAGSIVHAFVSPYFEEGNLRDCYLKRGLSVQEKLNFVCSCFSISMPVVLTSRLASRCCFCAEIQCVTFLTYRPLNMNNAWELVHNHDFKAVHGDLRAVRWII